MRRRVLGAMAVLAGLLGLLVAVLFGRAATLRSQQVVAAPVREPVDADAVATRLSEMIQFETVSTQGGQGDHAAFEHLIGWMQLHWPRTFDTLRVEIVPPATVWLTWPGSDPSLDAALLLAHTDVVPVEPGTEAAWTHPPFGGVIAGGFVWGRGALDDKVNVIGVLEALERAVTRGFAPRRTLYAVFGHDEEIGGEDGAKQVAEVLAARGERLYAVVDEGLPIVVDQLPGIPGAIGLIGVSEKGYLTLELTATAEGGHSSRPPARTAVGALATALERLRADPFPGALDAPAAWMFDFAAPEMTFGNRVLFGNRWLFDPVIVRAMSATSGPRAALATTVAPTMLHAGIKENVLPSEATATVNLRLHPRDSVATAVARVKSVIADPQVRITIAGDTLAEPAPISRIDGPAFRALQTAYAEVFHGLPVAPGLMIAATDSRHFTPLCDSVYRASAVPHAPADLPRIHGTDERIAVDALADVVRWYGRIVYHLDAP